MPNLTRTQLAETPEWKSHRAGFTSDGTPSNLHVVRSMRGAIGRRIAIGSESRRELRHLEARLESLLHHKVPRPRLEPGHEMRQHEIKEIEERIEQLRQRISRIPYLDPIDLRYRSRVRVPVPTSKAVMFCLMDVSGSMDESRKDLAKRFFILLYLFLTRHYDKIDIVFIRHHTQAQEVDEQNFFHATETGGTVVSSALVLMEEIVRARYPSSEWNIYGAQASDGDNWHHDSGRCRELLAQQILPLCRYFAYVQVAEEEQNLWDEYSQLAADSKIFAMRKVTEAANIYPVFRDLFKKEGARVDGMSALADRRPAVARAPLPLERAAERAVAFPERLVVRADRSLPRRDPRHRRALRARHLSEPARGHHRRADDGRLCVGRHAGELPPLELRQGIHLHGEELSPRPHGARLRNRHQLATPASPT